MPHLQKTRPKRIDVPSGIVGEGKGSIEGGGKVNTKKPEMELELMKRGNAVCESLFRLRKGIINGAEIEEIQNEIEIVQIHWQNMQNFLDVLPTIYGRERK